MDLVKEIAQTVVRIKSEMRKASFASRSEAGRYAANQRWKGQGKKGKGNTDTAQLIAYRQAGNAKDAKLTEQKIEQRLAAEGKTSPAERMAAGLRDFKGKTDEPKGIKVDFKPEPPEPTRNNRDLVRQRVAVAKESPTSSAVHVDTIMGNESTSPRRKKKRKKTGLVEAIESLEKAENVPTDKELYARVKAEAKKKFDVYPSAYANAWLVREYKSRGGTYKVEKAKSPAWQREEGKNPKGGLNAKGRASYKRETGGTLRPPVKAGDNPRRASFLARMGNAPGPERDANGEPTRLLLSLQAWGASSKADARMKAKAISARNENKKKS